MANNYTKTMRQALQEAREYRDTTEGGPGSGPQKGGKKHSSADIKKAYGILNDPRYKQGNYSGAAKAIDKLSPGLSNHPDVKNAMKRANEELEEERSYTVIHTKHGKEVVKANGTYDAAQKYAKMKGLKDTSGVDAHLMEENLDLPATGDTTTSNASQEVEQVDLDEAKFTPAQISALQKAYAPLKGKTDYKSATGSKMNFNKLKNKMKSYSVSHLQQLSVADIPMVSDAAKELL